MELIRGLPNLRQSHRGCCVTIGTFDGIHLGHQALIRTLLEHGRKLGRRTMMLTFEPMPREYLAAQRGEDPPARLTSWRERWRVLERTGLDYVWQLRFDENLRQLSGEEFMQIIARDLQAAAVVIGHDFRFGRHGGATAAMLVQAAPSLGFEVTVVPPVLVDGARVSSSGIREALAAGDLARAARWLGRPYSMIGRVVRGAGLGRTLGFATANLRLGRKRSPLGGIFAVRVHGADSGPRDGVASLGTRPTFDGTVPLLEAHVFDFSGDLYGREIEVEFVARLRDELRFDSADALVEQMHRDAAQARSILHQLKGTNALG
jgi:riboflavin kinase/FMN adenylyltransferase